MRSSLFLALLCAAAAVSGAAESATAGSDHGRPAALAGRLVRVDSPTDRSSVQRDGAGNVSVWLRLADDADLSTFAAWIGRTNVASAFLLDPISRVGVGTLALPAGATYSLKVRVDAVGGASSRAGSRAGRRDNDRVRFTVVEAGPEVLAASLVASAANIAPTAAFTYGLTGLTLAVDGSGSSDPDGSIVDYSWDFGDEATATGLTASHPFPQAGTYTVTLTVTDDLGATDSAAFVVAPRAPNGAPTASFTYGLTGLTLAVDGSSSSDPDGPIVDYAWDFGDGMTGTGPTATHGYVLAGTYTVTLTVEDYPGATDSMAFVVAMRTPNGTPTASFTHSASGLEITVDALDSSDPDGPIVDYAWDFGDGMTGTGSTATHSYALAGTYTVTLTVADYPGATDSDGQAVTVAAAPTPTPTPTPMATATATPSATPTATPMPTPTPTATATATPTATPSATPTPTATPTPMPTPVFTFVPPPHYHVNEGATLDFSVTATLAGSPLTVTASGLPTPESFDGANFSWEGNFVDPPGTGRHEMTFSAGGESTQVVVGTTEYPLTDFLLFSSPSVPLVGPISIPDGGQNEVLAGAVFDTPFGESPIGGIGTNTWSEFIWLIADPSLASFASTTNVAVIDGLLPGTTTVTARFTDATLGEMAAVGTLAILEIVSIAVDPASLSFPEGSTEVFHATATLEDATETSAIQFSWSSSDQSVATVTGGSLVFGTGHIGNVTGQAQGIATITASVPNAAMVSGSANVTLVPALRNQLLYGMDEQGAGTRVVTIDTTGGHQVLAPLAATYDDSFGPSASHTTNELMVSGFQPGTGHSQIQRIGPTGTVTPVFTSDTLTQLGDTIDPLAIEYRPDGWAYFAMSEEQQTLSLIDPSGDISSIGGPKKPGSNEGFGPSSIAPFGEDLVYSGPWSFDLSGGFADLVARYDDATGDNDAFAWPGFSLPQLAAPGGDLRILDRSTGEIFRFVDHNMDGDHFEIVETPVLTAQDDVHPTEGSERLAAGLLPSGFDTLHLDHATGDMITTRIVGTAPQRIMVMRLRDLSVPADGDVDDAGEQTLIFDAGAPPGTDIREVRLKY